MKRMILITMIIIFLSGCSTPSTDSFSIARKEVLIPPTITVSSPKTRFNLIYGNDPKLEKAFNRYIQSGEAPNIITEGFVTFAYNTDQQPVIHATPFQETIISLQPGEKFTNVTSGDPARWSYAAAVSGVGNHQQQNILVKPSLAEISTNMIITTDKRIYNLKLVSTLSEKSTKSIRFWYPEEMVNAINYATLSQSNENSVASVPDVSLNKLNFNYRISSDSIFQSMPSWKPIRVFDDGSHTYIQFPADITNKDMPVLFVLNKNAQELVNYRSKSPYFVVDKVFKQAVLLTGVGHNQTKVMITNQSYS